MALELRLNCHAVVSAAVRVVMMQNARLRCFSGA
jgi:hypothetical protein